MGSLTKIYRYIGRHFVITKDKQNIPSIVKDTYGNQFPLTLSVTRNSLIKTIKFMLVEDMGFDSIDAEKIAERYVSKKYQEFCDYVMNI